MGKSLKRAAEESRTPDLRITNASLCQLSYGGFGFISEIQDSKSRLAVHLQETAFQAFVIESIETSYCGSILPFCALRKDTLPFFMSESTIS